MTMVKNFEVLKAGTYIRKKTYSSERNILVSTRRSEVYRVGKRVQSYVVITKNTYPV